MRTRPTEAHLRSAVESFSHNGENECASNTILAILSDSHSTVQYIGQPVMEDSIYLQGDLVGDYYYGLFLSPFIVTLQYAELMWTNGR